MKCAYKEKLLYLHAVVHLVDDTVWVVVTSEQAAELLGNFCECS